MGDIEWFTTYRCDVCDHVFQNSLQLRTHQHVHADQLIECSMCDRTFVSRRNLHQHQHCHFVETCGVSREELRASYDAVRQRAPRELINPPLPPHPAPVLNSVC
jgi:transposase